MDYQPLLDHLSQYICLTPEETNLLLAESRYRRYRKGQYVVQEGDICQNRHFVLSGCLRVYVDGPNGHEHTLLFLTEKYWTGDTQSYTTQTPTSCNIQCLEASELLQIPCEKLEQLYIEIPKLERFFRILLQQALATAEQRLIDRFSLSAKERYLQFQQQYPQLEQRIPQYMIASYLGITREFLSRIKQQLRSSIVPYGETRLFPR